MATILVITHAHDLFRLRHFMVAGLFEPWKRAGHRVLVREGLGALPPADIALLHVDLTVVPAAYVEAARRYPVVINGRVTDIGKRTFSQQLLARGERYEGAVIVKTNANAGGIPEQIHAEVALRKGERAGEAVRWIRGPYPVYPSIFDVPPETWEDPGLIVERFLPEEDQHGYSTRHWNFLGDRERCTRVTSPKPIVKGADATARVVVPVPEELRRWRERLGFDYGKFDFVMRDGSPIVIDVNTTPTVPATLSAALQAGMAELAQGIDAFLM